MMPQPLPPPEPGHVGPHRAGGYALTSFGAAQWPQALEMLRRCYPGTPVSWWQAGFERWRAVPPDETHPMLGRMMHGPQGLCGVALMFASRRSARPDAWWHVNPSSWAILPEARLHALWMARGILGDPRTLYTALTPIPSAERILRKLSFQPVSHHRATVAAPRLAWRREPHVRLLGPYETLEAVRHLPIQQALTVHQELLGCLVCAVDIGGRLTPMVWRPTRRRGLVPCADLIYTDHLPAVCQAAGTLSRFLLSRGFALMEFEVGAAPGLDFPASLKARTRLAKGPYAPQGVDHLYSELVYLRNA